MRPQEYAAARRSHLVDHAVDLGVEPAAAPGLVDTVLAEQTRRIERAVDPDPVVYAALERAVARADRDARGPRVRPDVLRAGIAALVAALVLGGLAWWQLQPPEQVTVPSFFSLDATEAGRELRALGLEGGLRTVPACEPAGLVLGSSPAAGARVDVGSRVVLRSAVGPDDPCPGLADRAAAWGFVRFARGGVAPAYARTVRIIVDGSDPTSLVDVAAADQSRWSGLLGVIAKAAGTPTRSATGYPRLVVSEAPPPAEQCGVPRPAAGGDRVALRLQVIDDPSGTSPCPLTVDLFRLRNGSIDAVVVYTAERDAISKWSAD